MWSPPAGTRARGAAARRVGQIEWRGRPMASPPGRPIGGGVVVGMLVVDKPTGALDRHRGFGCLAGQRIDVIKPGDTAFGAVKTDRRNLLGPVEAAERHRDRLSVVIAEGQGRP